MKRLTFLFCLISFSLFGQTFQDGFNFYLPPYDTTTQQFLPQFPINPIGANDFISIRDGHFSANNKRIRFWSINVTDAAVFPEKADAAGVAGQLRKQGFNLVRLHYFDQGKSDFSIFKNGQSTRVLNPVTLDKMEKLLSELKKNGIYADVNLNVAREFNKLDGVPDADSILEFGKAVTLFDPQLITLQKEYARNLLTHVNPYTGLSLVNDPVMGMVEITNENWFFLYWQSDRLKPISQGGVLTHRHNRMLEEQWNNFLIEKYGNTSALIESWKTGNATEFLDNPGFENANLSPWFLGLYDAAANAVLTQDAVSPFSGVKCAKVSILSTPSQNWQLQLVQTNCTIETGKTYTVKFAIKSSKSQAINFTLGKQTEPYTSYCSSDILVNTSWQQFSFTFTAPETRTNDVQFVFQLGNATGDFWVDEASLQQISSTGIKAGESLESKNIHRMYRSEVNSYSPKRVRDLHEFFVDLHLRYYRDMYNFLKNDLGVKVPVSGSNWQIGVVDARIQSELDYIDSHAYWDLDWDGKSFFNNSMIKNPSSSTFTSLGLQSVEGKPFTISEYNHPWPNRYQAEAPFFLAGFGSYNDADAVMLFAMSEADAWTVDRTLSPFNCGRNSTIMTMMPSFGYVYRNGLIAGAENTITVDYSENDMYNLFQESWTMYPTSLNKNITLAHKVRSRVNSTVNFDASKLPAAPTNPYTSDTKELIWDINGLFKINTNQFIGFVGFLNQFKNSVIGNIKIIDADKFAGVTCLALDKLTLTDSKKMLVTINTRQQNSNMVWSGDTKIVNNGTSPTIVEPTKVKLRITNNADSLRVTALGTKGEKTMSKKIYKPVNGNQYDIIFDQYTDHSLWYGIETEWGVDKTITMLKPEKGKEFKVNSSLSIAWAGEVIGKKKIEYSENNGRSWKTIINELDANIFSYNWTIPDISSDSCLIKVSDISEASASVTSEMFSINDNLLWNGSFINGMANWNLSNNSGTESSADVSGNNLSIAITNGGTTSWHVQLLQPGLKIEKGKKYDLSFDASARQARNIGVGVGQDGGSWASYFSQSVSLTTVKKNYSYSFTMNNNTDNNARFAIDLGGNNTGITIDDIKLTEHKISKSIAITSPVESYIWLVNKSYYINWTSNDINKINIYYKLGNQPTWIKIAGNIPATDGKYLWLVPVVPADSCNIKLEDAENPAVSNISPALYLMAPEIEILSPIGGEIFIPNEKFEIKWNSRFVEKINLYYKTLNSTSWVKVGSNINASTLKYTWTIPYFNFDSCQIKAEDYQDATINAISPKFFIKEPVTVDEMPSSSGDLLLQVYPNPFNNKTTMKYSISESLISSEKSKIHVLLKIYNSKGEEISTLVNEPVKSGNFEVQFDGSNIQPGIYLCKLSIDKFYISRKILLIR